MEAKNEKVLIIQEMDMKKIDYLTTQRKPRRNLEDAEYKDLNQRYKQDERDLNFVLNNQDAIMEARQAEDKHIELNESLDKIEEEQDRVF